MNDAGPQEPQPGMLDSLDRLPDEELREIFNRCRTILAGREQERRQVAAREIKRLAKEAGLKVDVGERRRRGRPPKKQSPSP